MMQELLGSGASLIGGERRIPIDGVILEPAPSQSSSSSSLIPTSTTSSTTSNTTKSITSTISSENLKCPRCDSSNTKFCYYNNYNLTQPRHFCKTCRRYWTKGGALRNVPIGGGCRKNKIASVSSSSSAGAKSSATTNNKMMKSMACEIIGRSGLGLNGFDHIYELPSSPALWASPQNNSHIFSLLRAGAMQNPNLNLISLSNSIKKGGTMGTHMVTEPMVPMAGLSGRAISFDPLRQVPSLGLCNPLWRNSQQRNGGLVVDDQAQNSGLQQLYQRLRASTDYYSDNSSAILLSNVTSSSVSTSSNAILESAPVVGGGDLGFWNPAFSWSDLPATTNDPYRN